MLSYQSHTRHNKKTLALSSIQEAFSFQILTELPGCLRQLAKWISLLHQKTHRLQFRKYWHLLRQQGKSSSSQNSACFHQHLPDYCVQPYLPGEMRFSRRELPVETKALCFTVRSAAGRYYLRTSSCPKLKSMCRETILLAGELSWPPAAKGLQPGWKNGSISLKLKKKKKL